MDEVMSYRSFLPNGQFHVKEPISALTHFIAFIAAIFATPFLLMFASLQGANFTALLSLSIFMLSMILLYGASSAYHAFSLSERGNTVLKKLDHTMIFLLIAGSYTPVCTMVLGGMSGLKLLILVWSLAIAGVIFKLCWVDCPKWVSSVIYISMGWSCLTAMPQILDALTVGQFSWLLLGGVIYTIGGVIYALKPKSLENKAFGNHELFHLFVMGGSACHYIFMLRFLQ